MCAHICQVREGPGAAGRDPVVAHRGGGEGGLGVLTDGSETLQMYIRQEMEQHIPVTFMGDRSTWDSVGTMGSVHVYILYMCFLHIFDIPTHVSLFSAQLTCIG